jgi:SAM-dependent methyltransferase
MSQWSNRAKDYEVDYSRAFIRAHVAKAIVRSVEQANPSVILDAGAGQGHLAHEIKTAHPRAHLILVDQSLDMLSQARRRMAGHERVRFVQSTFADLTEIPARSVDFFTSTFALHHVDDAGKFQALKEARRVLKPDGWLVIADEILCDPSLVGNAEGTLLAMGEVFYPGLSADELHRKFDGFVEYPTDLTTMAKIAIETGFAPLFRVINRVVAILEAAPTTN